MAIVRMSVVSAALEVQISACTNYLFCFSDESETFRAKPPSQTTTSSHSASYKFVWMKNTFHNPNKVEVDQITGQDTTATFSTISVAVAGFRLTSELQ